MIGQFHGDHFHLHLGGIQGYEAGEGVESGKSGQPGRFADELRRLMGEDFSPDTQFFKEAWTYGLATAAENWQLRQEKLPADDFHSSAFEDMEDIENFAAESMLYQGNWPEDYDEPVVDLDEESEQETASLVEDVEVDLTSDAKRMAAKSARRDRRKRLEPVRCMTVDLALTLLGVEATSSLDEIKVAYRRMAGLWHPDLLQNGTEEYRVATEQMATINDAYRVLRNRSRT